MAVTSVYPVLMTDDVEASAAWFERWLGFERSFSSDWYVSLRLGSWELALLHPEHETIPPGARGRAASGVLLNVEVDDVDELHRHLVVEGGVRELLPLRSEPFGQRHCIVEGPSGVLVDLITEIEPSPEFAAAFEG